MVIFGPPEAQQKAKALIQDIVTDGLSTFHLGTHITAEDLYCVGYRLLASLSKTTHIAMLLIFQPMTERLVTEENS